MVKLYEFPAFYWDDAVLKARAGDLFELVGCIIDKRSAKPTETAREFLAAILEGREKIKREPGSKSKLDERDDEVRRIAEEERGKRKHGYLKRTAGRVNLSERMVSGIILKRTRK